ncbi:DUF3883 domain-containing protein [Pectobacterium parvum]|uniref:DUF3883 domain-containing protein n=2 Tax=Pectobacterium parvum TaxID=2778550 RepID=A0AAP9IIT0_9GAMM|nr:MULTISPECIES: DUF3883 domain-containing protein [Pectobacterium]MCU1801409.1 DUF3883 domain-containing protein [Pectobacterium parvum]QHQ25732.1 DUF3883 domain-containing protein [Pectobacterium parvum]UFK37584.1 DUF3883 domain-containing protein [Pectobacterium parvum]
MAILFCNIGWMEKYAGIIGDEIKNGGEYVNKNKIGGEIINFYPSNEMYYGYVRNKGDFNLKKLTSDRDVIKKGHVDGVDIVWVAKGEKGRVIVGWYKNARVYKQRQIIKENLKLPVVGEILKKEQTPSSSDEHDEQGYYRFVAKQEDCVLLPVEKRHFEYPSGKGFMGQTPFWYGNSEESKDYIKKVIKYINSNHPSVNNLKEILKNSGSFRNSNVEQRLKTEKAAIEFVWGYYSNLGYSLKSVEKDNLGWDLEAVKNDELIRIEVKGLHGLGKQVQLSPNEYNHFLKKEANYRLCIVNDALSDECPDLSICYYDKDEEKWLVESKSDMRVSWKELKSAIVNLS